MVSLQLLLVILPLGLDTLGVSVSQGIKSSGGTVSDEEEKRSAAASYGWMAAWRLALLFSLAEASMPLIGLGIGYAASIVVSNVMHYAGPLLLIGVGAWELWEEGREYLRKRWPLRSPSNPKSVEAKDRATPAAISSQRSMSRGRPLLLALSVSLDELAIGFSLGSISSAKAVSPLLLCLLIGLQGFLLTAIGLSLGRALCARSKPLQEGSEYLGALLLIGLGIWLLVA